MDWDEPTTIQAVAEGLRPFGDVVLLEAVDDFAARLAGARVDLLFNMAEGFSGPSREAQVPAMAEFLGIRYTGSDPLTLAIALHKARTKEILSYRRIPTAPFVLVESAADLPTLRRARIYPAFLKPVWEGSSKGISQANYVETPRAAQDRAEYLLRTYRQPVLVEAYLPGDELTVAILGNGADARCLPLIRYRFDQLPTGALPVMGYEAKWEWDRPGSHLDVLECPAVVSDALARAVQETALAAYRALACRDWARIDVRVDRAGVAHVMEINPLPGIIPDLAENSCYPRAAAAAGLSYDALIQRVVRIAWRRWTGRELRSSRTLAGAAR
ncbi:MAG: D-alanine--D-alanine ligase [Gemmatimonadetes bacterium]|nr:D-alanine--D-alanine ligase [Gemmatimonadota bacterium]